MYYVPDSRFLLIRHTNIPAAIGCRLCNRTVYAGHVSASGLRAGPKNNISEGTRNPWLYVSPSLAGEYLIPGWS